MTQSIDLDALCDACNNAPKNPMRSYAFSDWSIMYFDDLDTMSCIYGHAPSALKVVVCFKERKVSISNMELENNNHILFVNSVADLFLEFVDPFASGKFTLIKRHPKYDIQCSYKEDCK